MEKEELLQKIDGLISDFTNAILPTIYERTLYETDELLRSLFPVTDETYRNFIKTAHSSQQYIYKANIMTGILRGVKSRISICENKKYQVFISSTYVDLIPYRNAISEAIIFANHIPAGMENFKASSNNPTEYIKKVIDQSDYYVLMLGQRYGSIQDTEHQISFTMMEYKYAIEKGMVVLPFFYNGSDPLPNGDLETQGTLFAKFKATVAERHVVSYFSTAEELKGKVTQSLTEAIINTPQRGWVRL